jgi:integral membrane protein
MNNRNLRIFRWVARAEGVSFLMLLFVAMPLKYLAGRPTFVTWAGWVHGILFIGYLLAMIPLFRSVGWPWRRAKFVLLAGLLPFGTFVLERKWMR